MKKLIFLFYISMSFAGMSQLSGDIVIDERKITSPITYQLPMTAEGKIVFDISVDIAGKVTSCIYNKKESTIRSTRYIYEAKNLILLSLKFEAGNGFPTHHQGRIIITPATETGH